jgi:hypothetical protein
MIDQIPLSQLKAMNDQLEGSPLDLIGMMEAQEPLRTRQNIFPSVPLEADPSGALRPKGSGKRTKLLDLSPAIKKMLARNKGKSQYGPNFRTDESDNTTRLYYADLSNDT